MSDVNEIDDFNEIEKSGKLRDDLTLSNIFNVKIGGFGDINFVRTYLTTLTVSELEKDISVYETLSKDKNWPVSQIIQREVDRIRVSNISKDYVLRKERIVKYFPPIVIAILPKKPDDSIALSYDFAKSEPSNINDVIFEKSNYRNNEKMRPLFAKAQDLSTINGFYLLQVSQVFDFNIMCWDKSKYYAVVIDGQHRLEALVQSRKQKDSIKNYHQDVVFVEFSQLITKLELDNTPVEVVRRVFVDINTNAKRVGIVRQILMDDKDLSSLLVQSLVDSVQRDGSAKEESKYLKSQLVDWYGESLKHNLPHITGVLALQQIINDYVLDGSMSSIEDMRSPNKVKKWVRTLNEYFFVDKIITKDNSEYSDVDPLSFSLGEYNRARSLDEEIYEDSTDVKESTLFVYDYRTLEIAQKSFENIYLSSMVYFFNEFYPYKEAYSIVDVNKGFDNRSTVYQALLSSRKKILSHKVLKDALAKLKAELETGLNQKYFILLTVLGQKTLFNLLFKRIFQTFNQNYTEETVLSITKKFLIEINSIVQIGNETNGYLFGPKEKLALSDLEESLMDKGEIASHFWEGIIYEQGRIIYNSQGIKSFTSAIDYVLSLKGAIESGSEHPPFEILYMDYRMKRILKKTTNFTDSEIDEVIAEIKLKKKEFLNKLLGAI